MRTHVVTSLADGIVNALTNINGGSTHCNLRDWLFWQGELEPDELKALYDAIIGHALAIYAFHGTPEQSIRDMLPASRRVGPIKP